MPRKTSEEKFVEKNLEKNQEENPRKIVRLK